MTIQQFMTMLMDAKLMSFEEDEQQYMMNSINYFLTVYDDNKYNGGNKEVTYVTVEDDKWTAYSAETDETYELSAVHDLQLNYTVSEVEAHLQQLIDAVK